MPEPRRRLVGAALGALAALLALLGPLAATAGAHPLGNFTVNRWARIEPTAGVVRITYVLDLAEIPSFQDRAAIEADPRAYARERIRSAADAIELRVDGTAVGPIEVREVRIDRPAGDGGLPTTRIVALLEAPVPGALTGSHELAFADGGDPARLGWREVVARAPSGARLVTSNVPEDDRSDQLRRYPSSRLDSPLDVRRAGLRYEVDGRTAQRPALEGPGAAVEGDRLGRLLGEADSGALAVAGLLGIAFLLGCGHALAPGHGKTIMAAYLVGTRGRPLDALLLGVIVSAMHTTSVLVLGVVLHQVDRSAAVERIYPLLTAASGVAVAAFGLWLLRARLRARRTRVHDAHHHNHHHHDAHEHGDHAHDHGGHDHGPGGHTHELPEGVAPLSRRGLLALASAGGVVPSPSAVVVLVSALALGRLALGLVLIVAFSVGLAATLSLVGLALVFGRRVADARLSARVIGLFPVLGAVAVVVLGTTLIVQGVSAA